MAKHIENSQLMFVDRLKKEYFPSIFFLPNFFLVILGGRWEQLAKSNRNLPAKKECITDTYDMMDEFKYIMLSERSIPTVLL